MRRRPARDHPARSSVLSRTRANQPEHSLRPCLAWCSRPGHPPMEPTRPLSNTIDTMLLEERRYAPDPEFARQANAQPDIYERDWKEFWETEGRNRLTWFEPFSALYEWKPPYAKWYLGGKLNVCFNCVDRHVEAGNGDKVAYY